MKLQRFLSRLAIVFAAFLVIFGMRCTADALTTDQSQLVQLTRSTINWVPSSQVGINGMAISGNYALVAWDDGSHSGGELLASNTSGTWEKIVSTGGQYSAAELSSYHNVPSATASFLTANLRPLPPSGGPSISAAGTSTHPLYSERCFTDTTPPRYYSCQYNDPSSVLTYQTGSVQPSGPNSAVVADITVTSGTAIVTLTDPNGKVLQSVTLTSGQTGGVGYISDVAPVGVYTLSIRGNVLGSVDPGGSLISTQTFSDAQWTGMLTW